MLEFQRVRIDLSLFIRKIIVAQFITFSRYMSFVTYKVMNVSHRVECHTNAVEYHKL